MGPILVPDPAGLKITEAVLLARPTEPQSRAHQLLFVAVGWTMW
jgi:hypothetical protein